MDSKAIIFGATGQDGYYLTELLAHGQIEVIGIARSGTKVTGDVSDYGFVEGLVKINKPDYIFHLAANSTTKHEALFDNHEAISTGTLNILETVRNHSPVSRVFLSGSAMQFKNEGLPINEQSHFEGSSPYSVARIQSVYAGRYYRDKFGLKVYVGYFFNHDSPFRSENHINQKVVRAVQRISEGSSEMIELGNIEVMKEFGFSGDVVEAVWLLVNQDNLFEAIIGTGKAYQIKDWVAQCFDKIGKDWNDYVTTNKDFKSEYNILVSDPKLIYNLGWKPKADIGQLVELMMANK